MGPQHVRDALLHVTQTKTGAELVEIDKAGKITRLRTQVVAATGLEPVLRFPRSRF